jgi:UTP--glucose-1-phosphate uridylyltransferase
MKDGEDVLTYNFTGQRYDIGSKVGLLKANIEFSLRNEETKDEIENYLKNLDINVE